MGLGKTVEIAALVLSRPAPSLQMTGVTTADGLFVSRLACCLLVCAVLAVPSTHMLQYQQVYLLMDNGYQAFWNTCDEHVQSLCEPAPKSLEANVLFMGANYLAPALKVAAEITSNTLPPQLGDAVQCPLLICSRGPRCQQLSNGT